ncbi:pmt family 4-amino-4-deoxy-l-arabinose transferase [Leptolyngbya sp. Heron Island J]|uniref:ArnT family glycosyltransferase n=1 Tax=Leptolyngbya sp. Heron Island J TaxID=1385935 RepID=UPI0003B96617|nr:glycosyltransferase family 39 protein [Leptolyngbya sp. Heron Island J]ESA33595.1 pmt family 4-amino-4-deoxy-l-arabinose transferase [Leptolyngbya sp. Heron Island J]
MGSVSSQSSTRWVAIITVTLAVFVAFFWRLGSIGLVDETEPLFAEAARQMYATGDWITPYFNGETRFDKPPLVYWGMALCFHIFGVGEWGVRLPSALAAAGLTGFSFYTLQRFGYPHGPSADKKTAFTLAASVGAIAMTLHPQTIVWARTGVSDMVLSGCIGAALLCFFWGYAHSPRWYYGFYIFMALAVLDKGPVGIVIPGLIVTVFAVYMGQVRTLLKEIKLLQGSLLALLLMVPWFVAIIAIHGQTYIDSFFGYHNYERFTDVVNGHAAPWYFYFAVVAVGFLPWSPGLPFAMVRLRPWAIGYWRRQPRERQLGVFALTWFLVIFCFFTAAVTKLPSYVLPLMPAAAIMVGLMWAGPRQRGMGISAALSILFFAILSVASYLTPNWLGGDPVMPDFPALVRDSQVMFQGAIVWGIATLAGLGLLLTRRVRWVWIISFIAFLAFTLVSILPMAALADSQRQLPLRQLAETMKTEQQPGETLAMVGFMKPSLAFYTQRPIVYIYNPDSEKLQATGMALVVGHPNEIATAISVSQSGEILQTAETYQLARLVFTP